MQDSTKSPLLGGPLEDKARTVVEGYLRAQESRVYDAVRAEALKHLPDPARPVKDLIDSMRVTLADFGITASDEELAKQLRAVLPQEIVKPIAELYGVLAPRFEWAMTQLLDNAKANVDALRDAVLAPVEARIRELFHVAFTAVTKKAAQLIARAVDAAVTKLMEVVMPIVERLVQAVLAAVAKAVAMAIQVMMDVVNEIGRMAFRFAKAVAMWIAKTIVMFVCKTILTIIGFLFGLPPSAVEMAWMESQATIRF
jgi:hypothetical protein